ncbi:MAG: hypothetical protein KF901_20140 [Myxococcales bacterium]|nr:hypothetical protein [Myxococcales bacterium]
MQQPTFFEGPEKKLELVLASGRPSLRALGDDVWQQVVESARAQIVSVMRNGRCDAYLLSESSLFVFDASLTMITCGRTRLVDAAERLLELVGRENVDLLVYQRKNEHFPDRQPSSFYEDAAELHQALPGRALRFGAVHDHHVHVFHTTRPYAADPADTTLEILMHGLREDVSARFVGCAPPATSTLAEQRGITRLLPGFQVDEHAFTPAGYSVNGLRDGAYFAVHVTPEHLGSYVSFETNVDFRPGLDDLLAGVLAIFEPRAFDVFAYAPVDTLPASIDPARYRVKDHVRSRFAGYDVAFWHCYAPLADVRAADELPLRAR